MKASAFAKNRPAAGKPQKTQTAKSESVSSLMGALSPQAQVKNPPSIQTPAPAKPVYKQTDPLMGSGYCYGCIFFSVDAPKTAREMAWCQRISETGEMSFRRIPSTAKIKQCPGKMEE